MVRLVIHSPDSRLTSLLNSALKSDYTVIPEFDDQRLRRILHERPYPDVLVLDFDSNHSPLEKQLEFYDGLSETLVPIIVMTDDLRRSTAMEFLRRGAFDCIRKPPSLLELRVIIERAHEHSLMKAEL